MRSRVFVTGAVVALVGAGLSAMPAGATPPELVAMRHGVVDFGDAVPFGVDGPNCASTRVAVVAVVDAGTVEGPGAVGCAGEARVPSYQDVVDAGWQQGEPIALHLTGAGREIPLRYQRIDVDHSAVAAGAPAVWDGTSGGGLLVADPDTGPDDEVLAMATGDAVALGRVDVERVDSIALRICIAGQPYLGDARMDAPVHVSVHQDSVDGAALVHRTDVSDNPAAFPRLSTFGFGGTCWRLVTLPITGERVEKTPELFLTIDLASPGTLLVNAVDFNGTGARSDVPNWVTPDPAGMETIFDGMSLDGWDHAGCALRDGAVTNDRTGDRTAFGGCSITHQRTGVNRVFRFETRRESFFDNGAISVSNEVQLRSVGEYLPGGYFGEYAARWQKLNSFPTWSQVEIVQLGARFVVRVNGRTVTDHVASTGEPAPYALGLATQPIFSYRFGAGNGFGHEVDPDVTTPDEWGGFWFRNVRVYECASVDDPVCVQLADVNEGQAPKAAQ